MSQSDIRTRDAATFVGLESTFGVTPTVARMFPVAGMTIEHSTAEVENETETVNLYDYQDPVLGMQDASAKFDHYIAPYSAQYTSAQAPVTHSLGVLLKAGFGGHQANTGSLVSGSASTTGSVNLPSGHGLRFAQGQLAGIQTTAGIEVRQVISIVGDALSVFPALSAAPTTGSAVVNMDNFYPTETNAQSLHLQHAKAASSAHQWALSGCFVESMELSLTRNDLVKGTFNCKAAAFSTGSLGLSTAVVSNPSAAPLVLKDAKCLLQPVSTTTALHYPLKAHSVKLNFGLQHVEESGGIEGKTSVARSGQRMFAEVTLKFRADPDSRAYWRNRTKMLVAIDDPYGAGATQRHVTVWMPSAIIVGEPKVVDNGNLLDVEITLRCKINQIISSPSTDLARAPFILALG